MVSLIPSSLRASWHQRQVQRQHADRLERQHALFKDLLPIECPPGPLQEARRREKQAMATWSMEAWERHDEPWARLLAEWLATDLTQKENRDGLHDLMVNHQKAWWNARFIANRPEQTAVTRLVWAHLEAGATLPKDALSMASMSSPGWTFSHALWRWAMKQPTLDGLDMAFEAFRYSLHPPSILNALSPERPERFDYIWKKASWFDQPALLRGWVLNGPPEQADPWLNRLKEGRHRVHRDGGGRPIVDAWHEGFVRTLGEALAEKTPDRLRPAIAQWVKHWPGTHEEMFEQAWRQMWHEQAQGKSPTALAANLDKLTHLIEPIVPLTWWTQDNEPAQWRTEWLQHMPETTGRLTATRRQMETLQNSSPGLRRPRMRS